MGSVEIAGCIRGDRVGGSFSICCVVFRPVCACLKNHCLLVVVVVVVCRRRSPFRFIHNFVPPSMNIVDPLLKALTLMTEVVRSRQARCRLTISRALLCRHLLREDGRTRHQSCHSSDP